MKDMEEKTRDVDNEKYMQGLGVKEGTIAQVTKDEMIKNLRNDVTGYETALESSKKALVNYREQLEVDKQLWDITEKLGAMEPINPEYNYQKDPEFAQIAMKKQYFQNRQERAIADGQLKQFEDKVTNVTEALARAKEKLKKFEDD